MTAPAEPAAPTEPTAHWERVYTEKTLDTVSWHRPRLERSLRLLVDGGVGPASSVIDIGGGASTLVDDLLDLPCAHVTVLDISERALALSRTRLGPRAAEVTWIAAGIASAALPPASFDAWHDRAVFHFLTAPEDRRRYVAALDAALRPGGAVVLATFAPDGPPRCSGLEVRRYDADGLATELGSGFMLVASEREAHTTPSGAIQHFQYALFRKVSGESDHASNRVDS